MWRDTGLRYAPNNTLIFRFFGPSTLKRTANIEFRIVIANIWCVFDKNLQITPILRPFRLLKDILIPLTNFNHHLVIMKHSALALFAFTTIISISISCKNDDPSPEQGLQGLPPDTGGTHTPHTLGSDASPYAYYMYTPSAYKADGPKYPLLIFLHGAGEKGNSQVKADNLNKILVNGPPKLIQTKTWNPKYPMLVASLQCHDDWWDANKVTKVTEFLMANYAVDTTRIYMTGLSMGGYGTWDQVAVIGKNRSHITAALPICGSGFINSTYVKRAAEVPIWTFHGDADPTVNVSYSINMVKAINETDPKVKAKVTIYPGVGHDSWTMTYNGKGMGKESPDYDPFNMDVFEWLLQYQKE